MAPRKSTPATPPTPDPSVPDAPDNQADAGTVETGHHNPTVHALLLQAKDLREEKGGFLKRVEANRSSLRMLKATGFLSTEQGEAIDAFYPPNVRKQNQSQDEDQPQAADPQPTAA